MKWTPEAAERQRQKRWAAGVTPRGTNTLSHRFEAKVKRLDSGCWEWTGRINPKCGYGVLYYGGPTQGRTEKSHTYAHRAAFELYRGEIPDGCELDHLCRNRWCCNPDHLDPVPHKVNALRGSAPTVVIHNSGKCNRGHEVNEANAYFRRDRPGKWNCRICRRENRERVRLSGSGDSTR